MATNPNTLAENVGRITAPSAAYPYGSAKDDSTGATGDGTPFKSALLNDVYGLQQALMRAAGITPSGNADTALVSEYMKAIVELASGRAFNYDCSGTATVMVLAAQTDQHAPASYFDGMTVRFEGSVANTASAFTVNVDGLGAVSVKLRAGAANPPAETVSIGGETVLVYRTLPSAHFEIDRSGQIITTVVTATDATWDPQPDTKSIKFTALGAAGGGGGVPSVGSGACACAGGGGGGATVLKTTNTIDATYAITIGVAGATSGGANVGNDATDTTVVGSVGPATNVDLSAGGGLGGAAGLNSVFAFTAGGAGGVPSGGDVNIVGNSGSSGMVGGQGGDNDPYQIGHGGVGFFGGRQVDLIDTSMVGNEPSYGTGGQGAASNAGGAIFSGNGGGPSQVRVEEYL